MNINSQLLKNSLKNCYQNLKLYHNLLLQQSKLVNKLLITKDVDKYYPRIKDCEHQANEFYMEQYNTIAWYLSQHQPVSLNLKYFLSFIAAMKEFERQSDANFKIAKVFSKNIANCPFDFMQINKLYEEMLKAIKQIWNIFNRNPFKISSTDFKEAIELQKNFLEVYHETWTALSSKELIDYITNGSSKKPQKLMFQVNFILIKIERSLDCLLNIVESFYLIHHSYFDFEQKELKNE